MTKILLIASIVLSLGAAGLGFLNRDKLETTKDELENAASKVALTDKQLESLTKDLEAKKAEITGFNSEKDQLTSQLGEAKTELDKSKADLTAATEKATALEAEVTGMKADAEAKDLKIAELLQRPAAGGELPATAGADGGTGDPTGTTAALEEARTLLAAAQDENTTLKAQIEELRSKDKLRQTAQMRQGLQGTILAVNQAWNFVVLSLGDRQGVVANAEMLVQRGNQLLGKIRITSVEPSTSIADIMVRTVPRGFTVMPGDTVIYQAKRD
jgi:septal ring factor EnvC (AmiA/AmiB activator)